MGHVPIRPYKSTQGTTWKLSKSHFLIFILHLGMFKCFLFIVFILYFKGPYTFRPSILTNFIFLWFPTLTIISVKLVIFFILVKTVCKACYNNSINTQMCYFYCIFRALWPVTSEATGAPQPLYFTRWV